MAISPARIAAFDILLRVERESAFAVELLHSALLEELCSIDRGLANELVMGVLRWRSALDASIAYLSFTPFKKLDLEVLIALRLGVYQKQFLSKMPPHAVVNETVELVKYARKTSAAGLVNAVMRKVKSGAATHASNIDSVERLAAELAHPRWLLEKWVQSFSFDTARQICEYDQRVPATSLRVAEAQDEEKLREEGIQLAPGTLMRSARVVLSGDVTSNALVQSGKIAIQDEGPQLVAALVGEGKRILDCCAAPGGKTSALATRLPDAEIFAVDLHPHRARLLRRLVSQRNVHVVAADALALPFRVNFDRVLADVPCSGTGTLARNPEIKWKLRPEDIMDLQQRQIAILRAAMQHVAPGGRLIYSTCSMEPEENEEVIKTCLQSGHEFKIVPVREELVRLQESGALAWPNIDQLVRDDFLRTIPGTQPCDGFFAAILQRS